MSIKLNRFDNKNFNSVEIGDLEIFFSYETPIGFRTKTADGETVVSDKKWSNTTGRHKGIIDPFKDFRVPHEIFEQKLNEELNKIGLD